MCRQMLVGTCLGVALLVGVRQAETARPDPAPARAIAEERGAGDAIVLKPARVFDGVTAKPHTDWVVVVREQRIEAAGPKDKVKIPEKARVIDLPNVTLMPG